MNSLAIRFLVVFPWFSVPSHLGALAEPPRPLAQSQEIAR
jgi:hypothetical protein